MSTKQQKSNFVAKTSQSVTKLLESIDELNGLLKTWIAVGMNTELSEEGSDLTSVGYEGLTASDVSSVFVALEALNNLLDSQFQRGNLEKLKF